MRHPTWFAYARACLLALALLFASSGCATHARADEAGDIAAFARLYSAVRYYYPGDAARTTDWNRFAVHGVSLVRAHPGELAATLRELFKPVAAGVQVVDENASFAPASFAAGDQPQVALAYYGAIDPAFPHPTYRGMRYGRPAAPGYLPAEVTAVFDQVSAAQTAPGRVADFPLGRGLKARVPLSLPSDYARSGEDAAATKQLQERLAAIKPATTGSDTRVADVVVAWSALAQFYPYWQEADVDWDARLPSLVGASLASTNGASHDTVLEKLVEAIRDGHGRVQTSRGGLGFAAQLQITIAPVGGEWVVVASVIPDHVAVGDVVRSIDGVDAARYFADAATQVSGSPQWKARRVLEHFHYDADGTKRSIRFSGPKGEYGLRMQYALIDSTTVDPLKNRPAPVSELEPGIWYIDTTRTKIQQIEPKLDDIAKAKAVIVDVRGYPLNSGKQLLPHFMDAPEHDRWMHVPVWTAPFAKAATYDDVGWDVAPRPPHIAGARYVLMDGGAISYAESVLGYYKDLRLATTIGSPSAGANGDIVNVGLPSGAAITFTGLKVTRHDGTTPRHLVGIEPDVKVEPTVESIRAGKDIVLERALELARASALKP